MIDWGSWLFFSMAYRSAGHAFSLYIRSRIVYPLACRPIHNPLKTRNFAGYSGYKLDSDYGNKRKEILIGQVAQFGSI